MPGIDQPVMENISETPTAVIKPTFDVSTFGTIYNGHILWIGCEVGLILMTIILGYITCCVGRYALTLARNCQDIRQNVQAISIQGISDANKSEQTCGNISALSRNKYKRIMVYICLLASVSTLIKFVIDQVKFFYAWKARDDAVCEILYDVSDNALFSIAYLSVYGFLWMKQWLFYRDPVVIGILYNKKLIFFSKIFGPVVLILGVTNVTINIIPIRFKAGYSYAQRNDVKTLLNDETYLGCVSVYEYTDSDQVGPLMSYAAITAIFQSILLGLFAYPILRQKLDLMRLRKTQRLQRRKSQPMDSHRKVFFELQFRKAKKSIFRDDCGESSTVNSDSSTPTTLESVHEQYETKMYTPSVDATRPIKRAIFWTSICIATDGGLFIVFAYLGKGTPLILMTVAQDIDIFVNILCLLATYNTWQYILFPICKAPTVTEDTKLAAASFMETSFNQENA